MKNKLREIRQSRNLTLVQLDTITGVSFKRLSELELSNSNPTLRTAFKISKGLDLYIEDIWTPSNPGECYEQ